MLVDFEGFTMNTGAVCKQYVHHTPGLYMVLVICQKKDTVDNE
jgi:hypothetical protein